MQLSFMILKDKNNNKKQVTFARSARTLGQTHTRDKKKEQDEIHIRVTNTDKRSHSPVRGEARNRQTETPITQREKKRMARTSSKRR
jgi:hypothetical protein